MKIKIDPALFRPVTIRLENQDELDQFLAIIENVAKNRIMHSPQVITVAKNMRNNLHQMLNEAETED